MNRQQNECRYDAVRPAWQCCVVGQRHVTLNADQSGDPFGGYTEFFSEFIKVAPPSSCNQRA